MTTRSNDWTEADMDAVQRLWGEGKTAQQISDEIGKSRSSILSKARRMGLERRDGGPKRLGPRPSTIQKQNAPTAPKTRQYEPSKERSLIANTAYGNKTSLMELGRDQCRWPVGEPGKPDFGFCAAEAKGADVYCAKHKSISSAPPRPPIEPDED